MKVYKKIIFDKNNKIIHEESYDYNGIWARLGIHYDYKSTRGAKAMEKQAKREKKLADKKAKREAKHGISKTKENKSIPLDQIITLDHLTNPDKK
jgi:hypothetical protein|tara:strand:+ start:653 stop:937 length:285 start_codon:yes stop_codon:yes gene_type:complete